MTIHEQIASRVSLIRHFHRGWITYSAWAREGGPRSTEYARWAEKDRASAWWWIYATKQMRERLYRIEAQDRKAA